MQRSSLILLITLLPLFAAPAVAENGPITVEADRLELNQQTGISLYQGNVKLQRDTLLLLADKLELHSNGKRVELAIADGSPVEMERRDETTGELIRARARHAEYRFDNGQLELKGEAHLWRGSDEFSGERLIYDSGKKLVKAFGDKQNRDNGRVRVIIQPTEDGQQ